MAIIKQGIMGGFSGKVGNVVGSSWKGVAVMKVKPVSVANPRTTAQVAQRTKFANVVAFAQLILATIIQPLWNRFASQSSGFNDFIKQNINLFDPVMPWPAANLVISKGKMAAIPIVVSGHVSLSTELTVSWSPALVDAYASNDDEVFYVAVHSQSETIVAGKSDDHRENGSLLIPFPNESMQSGSIFVYIAFRRKDGTVVSNTCYKVSNPQ